MSETNLFGPILEASQVERDFLDTLKEWMPDYLNEIARILPNFSPGDFDTPRTWTTLNRFDSWPDMGPPMILVMSPGLSEVPKKKGDGSYWAKWIVGVASVVSARDQESTNQLSKVYAAAVRSALLQHPGLQGSCQGLDWTDEKYTDLPPNEQDRTLAAATLMFHAEYKDVVNESFGPIAPSETPEIDPGPWPSAAGVSVEVDIEAVGGP